MTSDLVKQIHVVIKWPTNNMENIAIAYFFLNKAVIVCPFFNIQSNSATY